MLFYGDKMKRIYGELELCIVLGDSVYGYFLSCLKKKKKIVFYLWDWGKNVNKRLCVGI